MRHKFLVTLLVSSLVCLLGVTSAVGKLAVQYNVKDYEEFTGNKIESFSEAPMLRTRVAAGELPPVEERLPEDFAVVTPVEEIGQYGGMANTYSVGDLKPGGAYHLLGTEPLFQADAELTAQVPNLVKSYEVSDGGKVLILYLRKGLRWSDGVPFTADDFLFWYEDILSNEEITPAEAWYRGFAGGLVEMEKLDMYTVRFQFATPYAHALGLMSGATGSQNWFFAPKHYLRQFHPRYTSKDKLEKMAKDFGYDYWYQLFNDKYTNARPRGFFRNPDSPSVSAYMVKERTSDMVIAERNPYYWKVDPAGNQLPYIDEIRFTAIESQEVLNMKIISGEVDCEADLTTLLQYPLYKQNAEAGGYRLLLSSTSNSADVAYFVNQTHKDPVLRKILNDKKFRQALSLAINREELNQALYFGMGKTGQASVIRESRYYEEEFGQAYAEYNPEEANRLLDEMGLNWDEQHQYRLRPDGKRLHLLVAHMPTEGPTFDTTEIVKEHWKDIGVEVTHREIQSSLFHPEWSSGNLDMCVWMVNNIDDLNLTGSEHGIGSFDFSNGVRYWSAPGLPSGGRGDDFPPEFAPTSYPFDEIARLQYLSDELNVTFDEEKRTQIIKDILRSQAENLWIIGTVSGPHPIILSSRLRNIPEEEELIWGSGNGLTWFHPEQFFFAK